MATPIEYGLIAALVGVVIIIGVTEVGGVLDKPTQVGITDTSGATRSTTLYQTPLGALHHCRNVAEYIGASQRTTGYVCDPAPTWASQQEAANHCGSMPVEEVNYKLPDQAPAYKCSDEDDGPD